MRVIDKIFAEIQTFNGESFTLIDISHEYPAQAFLHDLVALNKIKILPEKTFDGQHVYAQCSTADFTHRRAERLLFHKLNKL